MKTTRSLSFFVTVWMAAALAVSMGAYAVYERTTMPGLSLRELAVQHLGHVLGLGAMIYVLCWGVFYFVLLRPLNRIYLHLYTVGAGQLKTLELNSNVREIRTIVDGVNLMLSRLTLGADTDALELAQQRIAEIQEMTRHPGPGAYQRPAGQARRFAEKPAEHPRSPGDAAADARRAGTPSHTKSSAPVPVPRRRRLVRRS